MSTEEVFVPLDSVFDWGKVVVEEPDTFTKGNFTVEWTTSKVYFLGENGEKHPNFFELAKQNLWVVNGIWPFGCPQEDQNLYNIDGFQIYYPLPSVEKPTPAVIATRHTFNMMWETTVDAMKKFCEMSKEDRKVPSPTYSAYMTCKDDVGEISHQDWKYAVRPIYEHQKSKREDGKKFIDPTKPLIAYIKLDTNGKGKNIKCYSKIFGPGEKKLSPFSCMNVHGTCHPVVHWESIYWGAQGQASYGASVRLRVGEMNFTPCLVERSVSTRRMLPPVQDDDDDELTFGKTVIL